MKLLQNLEYPLPDERKPLGEPAKLPLVSIIIVNFNYGRFLHQTIASVLDQTYPHTECILVDNASTDETPAVLDEILAHELPVKIIRRASNDGQTPASLDGLAASTGAYVIFVDADDMLLPRAVEIHVLVHLSMRIHVGFTSGDMLQVAENQVVVSTGEELNRYIRSGKGRRSNIYRPYCHPYGEAWPSFPLADSLAEKIHYVPPLRAHWVWSPTSGNCYRRDALNLFSGNPELATLRTGTDMYFAKGISALCGSVLIDEPVFSYRIHGSNIFSRHAQLHRVLCYEPGGSGDNNDKAILYLIDHLVANAGRFIGNEGLRWNFLALLYKLDLADQTPGLPRWAKKSRLSQQLVLHYKTIAPLLGRRLVKLLLLWLGTPPSVIYRL